MFAGYVSLVPEADIMRVLAGQLAAVRLHMRGVLPAREDFRYAPGKWSIREVFGHMADTERVMGYRAFCISRGEEANLPGFDEQQYIAQSRYATCRLAEAVEELAQLRAANLTFLRRLDAAGWQRSGTANGSPVSVRALGFIMAGHVRHHLHVLGTRYA